MRKNYKNMFLKIRTLFFQNLFEKSYITFTTRSLGIDIREHLQTNLHLHVQIQ